MNESDALMRSVLDNPDDDMPRLVYADWLEEHDDPLQAQFIRAQCELARTPRGDPGYHRVSNREYELLRRYEPVWRARLPDWAKAVQLHLQRGFGAIVTCTAHELLHFGPQAFERFPIQHARLTKVGSCLEELLRWPLLARLRSLVLFQDYDWINAEAAKLIANCPYLSGLKELDLGRNMIGLEGVTAITHSPHLRSLSFFGHLYDGR